MANDEQVLLLKQGEVFWNEWRRNNPNSIPDLSRAELQNADLSYCDLRQANLRDARLMGADLRYAALMGADLRDAKINDARAPYADFTEAKLQSAYLWGSDFREAIFRNANLREANLMNAQLVRTDFRDARLAGARIYGISAWDLELEGAEQSNLNISAPNDPDITADDLEVAQFIYLLLNNEKLRNVIDTLTTKVVLILGRFTPERLAVLEAIRTTLRQHDYVPVLFNFEGPKSQTLIATVLTVARLARFVVADITDAKAVDQELQAIVPQIKVPIRPLFLEGAEPPGTMLQDLWLEYPDRLLRVHRYRDLDGLRVSLKETVIDAAEARAKELKLSEPESIFE